jgi:hypothetical protein
MVKGRHVTRTARSIRPRRGGLTAFFRCVTYKSHRLILITATAFLAITPGSEGSEPATKAAPEQDEYTVKTAFVYRMAELVTWPKGSLGAETEPVTLGIIGTKPDITKAQKALQSRTIHGHPITVVAITDADAIKSCHIIFVSRDGLLPLDKIVAATGNQPILTIGETKEFIEQGGIINFVMVDKKIRFEINNARARQANLLISSRLLGLATRVIAAK